jgi:hypothetical protein
MKKSSKILTRMLLAVSLSLGLTACGTGQLDTTGDGGTQAQPATLFTKAGAIATDSWGYTGSTPVNLAAPDQAAVMLKEHTLLEQVLDNGFKVVVSGISFTKVSYSSDVTTLPAAAQAAAPARFVSYVALAAGVANATVPGFSITVDGAGIPAGEAVTIYNYDASTRRWTATQTAVVTSNGKIAFEADRFSLYGIFRP